MIGRSYYHGLSADNPLLALTLADVWERCLKREQDTGVTWVRPFERLTYRDIYRQAMLVAKGLISLGIERGDVLCCFGVQGSDSLILFAACSSIGIIFMEPTCDSPVRKCMKETIDKIKPRVIVFGDARSGLDLEPVYLEGKALIESIENDETSYQIPFILYDKKAEESLECIPKRGWLPLSEVKESGSLQDDNSLNQAKYVLDLNEPCFYVRSSGTTGVPKFLLIGQALLTNFGPRLVRSHNMNTDSIYGCQDMVTEENVILFTCCAFTGSNLIIFPHRDTVYEHVIHNEILQAVQDYRIQYFYYTLYYINSLIRKLDTYRQYDLSSLRGLLLIGSLLTDEMRERVLLLAPDSVCVYGQSECFILTTPVPGDLQMKPLSVGKPADNVEVRIVDEDGVVVPWNTMGEIQARGFPLFLEYKDQPELRAKVITKDGWLKTGDCGSMDEEGYIYVKGRMAEFERFKVYDDIVYPGEIEAILRQCPKINECLVVGTTSYDAIGHDLNYVVEPVPGLDLTREDVKEYAMQHMSSRLEWPMRVFIVDVLPRTSSGRIKVIRGEVKKDIERRVKVNPYEGRVERDKLITSPSQP